MRKAIYTAHTKRAKAYLVVRDPLRVLPHPRAERVRAPAPDVLHQVRRLVFSHPRAGPLLLFLAFAYRGRVIGIDLPEHGDFLGLCVLLGEVHGEVAHQVFTVRGALHPQQVLRV